MLKNNVKTKILMIITTLLMTLAIFNMNNKVLGYEEIQEIEINPLYEPVMSEEEKQEIVESFDEKDENSENDENITRKATTYNATTYTTYNSYVKAIQNNLVKRNTKFTLLYKTKENYTNNQDAFLTFAKNAINDAMSENYATSSDLGDYMSVSWKAWRIAGSYSKSGNYYIYNVIHQFEYYTTYAQEQALNKEVAKYVANKTNNLKSDYELIYDLNNYICENVSYDYTNLNNTSHFLKYTAYAALMNKTAVCQGYAALCYKILEESGIDSRVVVSTELNHAWNIVELDGVWYNLDTTWNDTYAPYHQYFMQNQSEFDHYATDTIDFYNNFNMASTSIDIEANRFNINDVTIYISNKKPILKYTGTILTENKDYTLEKLNDGINDYYRVTGINKFKGSRDIKFKMESFSYSGLTPTSVKFTWGALDDAEGYVISNVKTNTPIAVFTGETSFTYPGLTPATMYEFDVMAYKTVNGQKEYSVPCRINFFTRPNTVTGLKATATTTSAITLKWNAQSNVKGYKIYRYDSKTKKYKYYAKTTSNTYTAKKLSAGTTYSFRVTAYMTVNSADYGGAASATLKAPTKPKAPTIKKITTKSRKANLSWGRVTGTTGYEIYMKSSKNGKYKKIKTITKAGTLKYTKSSLKKGRRHYFRIRAYKKVNGKTYYSSFSTTKSIVIK